MIILNNMNITNKFITDFMNTKYMFIIKCVRKRKKSVNPHGQTNSELLGLGHTTAITTGLHAVIARPTFPQAPRLLSPFPPPTRWRHDNGVMIRW